MKLFRRASEPQPSAATTPATRLHIGCGQEAIPGWINIDNQELPGVDRVLDVRQGLPFQNASAIYAEHFLEHLALEDGLAFLRECRRTLAPEGILRLSTPNLDWVYATHYRTGAASSSETKISDCFQLNRAFHGWGHQFLYNRETLESVLHAAGFRSVSFYRYGESGAAHLRGLERHQKWEDTPDLPHVIIAEASGSDGPRPLPAKVFQEFLEAIHAR